MTQSEYGLRVAASELMTAVGNTNRLLVLKLLLEGEMSVGKLACATGLSQSALSQHLAKLRAKSLVQTRRDKQMVYYSCSSPAVRVLLATMDNLIESGEIGRVERLNQSERQYHFRL